jgi:hypothetical protein
MSKYCPILERNVVYLDCLDCDEKLCEKTMDSILNENKVDKVDKVGEE